MNDGYYEGKIVATEVEDDNWDKGGMVACFDVEIGEAMVRCRHKMNGDNADKTQGVFKHLGLDWPGGVTKLNTLLGTSVRVRAKTSPKGRQNYYISTPKDAAVLDDAEINRRLAAAAGDDTLPF